VWPATITVTCECPRTISSTRHVLVNPIPGRTFSYRPITLSDRPGSRNNCVQCVRSDRRDRAD
jgi:hypothetical protein